MSNIVLIATNEEIQGYGIQLNSRLKDDDKLAIHLANMDEAVKITELFHKKDVDVIICRGATVKMLENVNLGIPIVDIQLSDVEVINAISEARNLVKRDNIKIGYIGFIKSYRQIKAFLDVMNIINVDIIHYDVQSAEDVHKVIHNIMDKVDIVVGGKMGCELAEEHNLKWVRLGSSMRSLEQAYLIAKDIQSSLLEERKVSEERKIIINSVSEGIISLDNRFIVEVANTQAEKIFNTNEIVGSNLFDIDPSFPKKCIEKAFTDGGALNDVIDINKKQYFVKLNPVIVNGNNTNLILSLQEVQELQETENYVRKKLYKKGNIAKYKFDDIIGVSEEISGTIEIAKQYSKVESNILIIGGTGTGKELFAQSIHNFSMRAQEPFVAVNCGAIPNHLIESELFGYTSGAFTGAKKEGKPGLFEIAHKGTIFLDEISEMDSTGQVILLRALQERQIRRIGGDMVIPIDVRVIAASNVDLGERIKEGAFRKDLYYRLSVLVLHIPNLNKRKGDIAYLANHYINQFNKSFGKNVTLTNDALDIIEGYNWDGNVRQLENFCEQIMTISPSDKVDREFIEKKVSVGYSKINESAGFNDLEKTDISSKNDKIIMMGNEAFNLTKLSDLLKETNGNRSETARRIGVSRSTLYRGMEKLGLKK